MWRGTFKASHNTESQNSSGIPFYSFLSEAPSFNLREEDKSCAAHTLTLVKKVFVIKLTVGICCRVEEYHVAQVKALTDKAEDQRGQIAQIEKEMNNLRTELEAQKEANVRSPSNAMKNLVERLKTQLMQKEKQLKVGLSSCKFFYVQFPCYFLDHDIIVSSIKLISTIFFSGQ